MSAEAEAVLIELRSLANPDNVRGMARYGINPEGTLGVSMPQLRQLSRKIGKNHSLGIDLWDSKIHEARILAALISKPDMLTESQMETWVTGFDSWDVCDQVCSNLFDRSAFAVKKAFEWSSRDEEFVRRAGFVIMSALAVHNKKLPDEQFIEFLPVIVSFSQDDRNFVKKAVNWALRQIGKRNRTLNQAAIATANQISEQNSAAARWIASDALRELKSEKLQTRLVR